MEIQKKIILTEEELFKIIMASYEDGFKYCNEKEGIFKKYGNSQNKDVVSYTKNKLKEIKS